MKKPFALFFAATLLVLAASGCGTRPSPIATPVPPTETPIPMVTPSPIDTPTSEPTPIETPAPTNTPTPTETPAPIPPTPTPAPATHTVCASGCDFGTIQAAIDDAATQAGAIIEIADPIHTEAGIVVKSGITVTIRGLEAGDTVVQAHETLDEAPERVLLIEKGASVTLVEMTVRHGNPSVMEECGGGIMNLGTLLLDKCVVSENVANAGAGICNRGALTLVNSTVSGNNAEVISPMVDGCGSGSGIKCENGTLALTNSTISGNKGEGDWARGGGVHVGCNCTAVFTNSTISGNKSVVYGGGIYVRGRLRLVNSTISGNTTAGEGGGVFVRGEMDYVNTIIANNKGRGGDCVIGGPGDYRGKGRIGTNRNNLVESGGCDPAYSGDPMLGPLVDNGGATLTHALLPGSPAIDAIPAISCTLPADQRGGIRPIVQTSPDAPCDIGAFEVQTE